MAQIHKYPILRHLRSEPSRHVLHFSGGRLRRSGRGLSFWFRPLSAALAELPTDDRELPFLFHARSRDFQDVTVQGVITWRVVEPEVLAERIDFSIDAASGRWREKPLEHLAELMTNAAQQHALDVLAVHDVRDLLEKGVELVRDSVRGELTRSEALEDMGLEVVAVAVSAVQPTAVLEQALQTPTLESIQQQADEATFRRRALAVEKERAISENELQSRIELATREADLIAQEGANEKRKAHEGAEARQIASEALARTQRLEAETEAEGIVAVEGAKVEAERGRMEIYGELSPHVLMGLAAREFAGKLERIEHFSLAPDRVGQVFADLLQSGSDWLDRKKPGEPIE
jgi:hypothetical protein